jgi:hypothetical protein
MAEEQFISLCTATGSKTLLHLSVQIYMQRLNIFQYMQFANLGHAVQLQYEAGR